MSRAGAAAGLLGLGFALLAAALTRGVFAFGDDVLYFQVTEAIVERHAVSVTAPLDVGDVARPIRGPDGRGYSKYGIGLSLVAVPAYLAGGWSAAPWARVPEIRDRFGLVRGSPRVVATGLTNAVLGGIAVWLAALLTLAAGFNPRVALLAAAAIGLATPILHHSTAFLSEPLSAVAFALCALGLVRSRPEATAGPRIAWLALSGLGAGLALLAKVANVVTLVPFAIWVAGIAWRETTARRGGRAAAALLAWGGPLLAAAAGIAAYNQARFGSFFETGYGDEATMFTVAPLTGLAGLLVSPGRGLLWYAPPAALALIGLGALAKRARALAWLTGSAFACTLALYCRYYQWYGGGSWGPRFLVPLLPLLAPALAVWIERAKTSRPARLAVVVTVTVGLTLSLLLVAWPFGYDATGAPEPSVVAASLWQPANSPLWMQVRYAAAPLTGESVPGDTAPIDLRSLGLGRLAAPLKWHVALAARTYISWPLLLWTYRLAAAALSFFAGVMWLSRARRPRR